MKKNFLKNYSPTEKRNFLFVYLLIAIPVIHFAIFWGYVNFNSILLAFQDAEGGWGFENFKAVGDYFKQGDPSLENQTLWAMLGRSFSLWAIANLVAFPIGLATTYVLFRRVCGHYVFRVCYSIPGIVGGVVWAAMVKEMVGAPGPIVYIIKNLQNSVLAEGLFDKGETAFPTLLTLTFLLGFVGGNAVVTGAYARIPDELYDVGKLDGIGFWREFFTVAIPFIWPTISTLVTFSLCSMFVSDGGVYTYTNGTGTPEMGTIGFYLTYRVKKLSEDIFPRYGEISAIGMLITLITVPVVMIGRTLLEKVTPPVES